MTINVLVFWSVLGASVVFLYGPWQVFWANWFRQEAFSMRDALFDLALKEQVKFNDPGYLRSRVIINALIRMADDLTWTHLLFLVLANKKKPQSRLEDISLSGPYKFITTSVIKALLISIVMRAPMLWPFTIVIFVFQLWSVGARGLVDVTNSLSLVRISQSATRALTSIWA